LSRERKLSADLRRLIAVATLATAMLTSAAGLSNQSETVVDGGMISGMVTLAGQAPAPVRLEVSKDKDVCGMHPLYDESLVVGSNNGIANAVVTLADIKKGEPLTPLADVLFDQKGCEYIPHVIAFPAGSTIKIENSDGILHSIHTESTINTVVDMAQPGFKKTITVTIEKPEVIKVTCDAHNWMEGWWYAAANPYYAVTGPDGKYTIKNVPPGNYTLEVWQEKLGVAKQSVTVGKGASVKADFTLKLLQGQEHAQ
jgi:plastocyanin